MKNQTKRTRFTPYILTAFLLTASLVIPNTGYTKPVVAAQRGYQSQDALIQFNTIGALMQGNYDGEITLKDIKRYGSMGIGTFDGLDGEMIIINRKVYQADSKGKLNLIKDNTVKSPFMSVTNLISPKKDSLSGITTYKDLKAKLDEYIVNKNQFYAIRVDGTFTFVKTRSVPKQQKPYPVLAEVTKNQPTFDYQNLKGSLVGFWCPTYADGVNVPGYHLHFISNDRTAGGHLLECNLEKGTLQIEGKKDFVMKLPHNTGFSQVKLNDNIKNATGKVE